MKKTVELGDVLSMDEFEYLGKKHICVWGNIASDIPCPPNSFITLDLVEHKINILDKNTMVEVEIPTIRARDTVEGIVYKFVESGDYCIRYSNGGRFLFCSNLSGFCIPITKADDVVEVCSINEFSKGEF